VRAIDYFMTYGELWSGSPLSLPIADEIAECLENP
jgi:hypothetical protein